MKKSCLKFSLSVVIVLFVCQYLTAQYEENEAYLVITGMMLNENPISYVKDPSFGKDAIVKITPKGGIPLEKQATEFSQKKDGLTYYTSDFKIPLDAEYSIEMKFSNGNIINIPNYKLLPSWKTHFYFHSTDGSLSPSCILRSQGGLENDLRLCVFAVYPYANYLALGGKQTFTAIEAPVENKHSFSIFPNPARNNAILKFNLDMPIQVNVVIKTISGILMSEYSSFKQQGENQINLLLGKRLPAGLYIVQLTVNGNEYTQKMMIF